MTTTKKLAAAAAAVVAAATLTACGGATTAAEPAATVTETVHVEQTPQACLDALDDAERVIELAGEGFTIVSDALTAAASFDVAGIDDATRRLNKKAGPMQAAVDTYETSAADCRASK